MEMYGYEIDGFIKIEDIVISTRLNYNVPNPVKIEKKKYDFDNYNILKPLKMTRDGVVVDSIISALILYTKGIDEIPYVYVPNEEYKKRIPEGYIQKRIKFINSMILDEFKLDGCKSARKDERKALFGTNVEYDDGSRPEIRAYKKSDPEIQELFEQQNGKCYICERELTLNYTERDKYEFASIDHIVPICKGGLDDISNYGLCCDRCNKLKGFNDLTDYIREKIRAQREAEDMT